MAIRLLLRLFGIILCLFLFIFALFLIKHGAEPLAPFIRNDISVDSSASALGFGWLSASLALSGSPVAAAALSLLDADVLSPVETFSMIAGSRLGAAFLVLVLGFLYILRGKQRQVSLSVGLLSLLVTQTIYPVVLILGYILLSLGMFLPVHTTGAATSSVFEKILGPIVQFFVQWAAPEALMVIGFLLVLFSLWIFDRIIPELDLKKAKFGMIAHLLYRPVVVFLLGAGITALTMSVSVSLSLLLPLSVRGYVRQENVIPYILGANITTFVDTLIAATLLGNMEAVSIVVVQMVSVTVVSIVILITSLRFYERTVHKLAKWIGSRNLFLVIYIAIILGVPLVLIWLG